MADDPAVYEPPPGPPPLLTFEQIQHLAVQGWLAVDLPADFQQGLYDVSRAASNFFDQSLNEKGAQYPSSRGTECGFYHVPDEKEYVTLRHHVHPESPMEGCARKVWSDAAHFLHRILCDLSRAGDYGVQVWDHLLDGSYDVPQDASDMSDITTLMRLFRYYPTEGIASEHVDIGLLTLGVGDGHGLQMLDRSKSTLEWVDAEGPVVLIGDMARALLNDRVRAGLHRVVGNPSGRSSVVYALRPNIRHPTDLATFGGEGVVDTREYFQRIKGRKYNVNARKDIRERQRQVQRKHKEAEQKAQASQSPDFG